MAQDHELAALNAEIDDLLEKIDREMEQSAAITRRLVAHYGLQPRLLPVHIPDKGERERFLSEGKKVASFAARIWNVIKEQRQHGAVLEKQAADIAALNERVRTLEARERELLARAEADATRAAAQLVADLARRIGRLEAGRGRDRSPD